MPIDDPRDALEASPLVVSSPGEFHPEALAEPDVRLAPHPAPVTRPRAERYASERTTVERVPSSCRAIGHESVQKLGRLAETANTAFCAATVSCGVR